MVSQVKRRLITDISKAESRRDLINQPTQQGENKMAQSTIAKQPGTELLALGYTNNNMKVLKGVENKDIFALRRDYLIDNMFVSDSVKERFDIDEDYSIFVITGLGCTLIFLTESHWDTPDRMAADRDGDVNVSSGNDEPFFTPSLNVDSGGWQHYDDELLLAGHIAINESGHHVVDGSHHHWTSCVCIPLVTRYDPGPETMALIQSKFKLVNQ